MSNEICIKHIKQRKTDMYEARFFMGMRGGVLSSRFQFCEMV